MLWAFEYATRATTAAPTTLGLPFPVTRCEAPAVRLFNRGVCTANCPRYEEQVVVNDEEVCLPTVTYQARRLVNSTLQATSAGAGRITLRIAYPLLPGTYSEDVNTTYVVDMKERPSDLGTSMSQDSCDAEWQRQTLDSSKRVEETTDSQSDASRGGVRLTRLGDHVGDQIQGLYFNDDVVRHEFTQLPPNTMARVSVTMIFLAAMTDANKADSLSLTVNGESRQPYWPRVGRTHENVLIHRQHVCESGIEASVPEQHCKATFVFDAESDEDGNLQVVINGAKNGDAEFTWAFANFKAELPFLETTLSFADLTAGACQLGPVQNVGELPYIERCGALGLALLGFWEDSQGPMAQRLNSVRWPLCIRFPAYVQGQYDPYEAWNTTIFDPVVLEGGSFLGSLELFEGDYGDFNGGSSYDRKRRVPRYELGAFAHAGHCLAEDGLSEDELPGLTMEFNRLLLSKIDDPTALDGIDLTDSVNVSHSAGGCVYFTFPVEELCEYCTLHIYSIVRAGDGTRRLSRALTGVLDPSGHRRLDERRLEHVQPAVVSHPAQQDGTSVNSLQGFSGFTTSATNPDDSDGEVPDDSDAEAHSNSANHLAAASMWAASICATMSLGMIV